MLGSPTLCFSVSASKIFLIVPMRYGKAKPSSSLRPCCFFYCHGRSWPVKQRPAPEMPVSGRCETFDGPNVAESKVPSADGCKRDEQGGHWRNPHLEPGEAAPFRDGVEVELPHISQALLQGLCMRAVKGFVGSLPSFGIRTDKGNSFLTCAPSGYQGILCLRGVLQVPACSSAVWGPAATALCEVPAAGLSSGAA